MMTDQPAGQLDLHGVDPLENRIFIVRKRDGRTEFFNDARIFLAIESAFRAEQGIGLSAPLDETLRAAVTTLGAAVTQTVLGRAVKGAELDVEGIQDVVERQLMSSGFHAVARRCILYREERRKARALREAHRDKEGPITRAPLQSPNRDQKRWDAAALLQKIYLEALPHDPTGKEPALLQREQFQNYIEHGVSLHKLSADLLAFDLPLLSAALETRRDAFFSDAGLQMLHEQYLLRSGHRLLETPQYFWMRIAMGVAIAEKTNRTERTIEFYEMLSSFRFVPSACALRNAGTLRPQLSACAAFSIPDEFEQIFATLGKAARFCANGTRVSLDWTTVQANRNNCDEKNPGIIPFLKTYREAFNAADFSGTSESPGCAALEIWHLDFEDFLNFDASSSAQRGLETVVSIPDLFMKRLACDQSWTQFDPRDVPGLKQSGGAEFEEKYTECERRADLDEIRGVRVDARVIWNRLTGKMVETGFPSLHFKDAANAHATSGSPGTMMSVGSDSGILLEVRSGQASFCPSGHLNLNVHVTAGGIDEMQLSQTVSTALRFLDNCIDITGFAFATEENFGQRPVALGITGYPEALEKLRATFPSERALIFADEVTELVSYYTILASAGLAGERGIYGRFRGSRWESGFMPCDLAAARNPSASPSCLRDWGIVRSAVKRHGIRNGSLLALSHPGEMNQLLGLNNVSNAAGDDAPWMVECALRQQRWVDMGTALTLPRSAAVTGDVLIQAWEKGLSGVACKYATTENPSDENVLTKTFRPRLPRATTGVLRKAQTQA